MTTGKPNNPVARADQKTPRAAVTEAFLVSSATWPEASNPTRIPAVTKNDNILSSEEMSDEYTSSKRGELQ